jgi:serine/threonine protein kinase
LPRLLHHSLIGKDFCIRTYQVLGILGEGGTGITYRVQDEQTQRQVALKILMLRQAIDWKTLELFEREAQILQQLQHPQIPRYLDYFVVDDERDRSFYIVQELAEGKPLSQWVEEGWHGTEEDIRAIALQILHILDYLHRLNPPVIHRDLKPQNLIRREDGQISLVDFGAVGSTYHNTLMRGSTVVGTYGYMAPEQFQGQAVPATDYYGLGATILFLLTRRSPAELPVHRLKIEFRSRLSLSPLFADWLEKMLEPGTQERYGSAKEAIGGLQTPMRKSSIPKVNKVFAGVFLLLCVFALPTLDQHRYYFINQLGLTQSAYLAILEGKLSPKEYLERGGDLNAQDDSGQTLIFVLVRSGKLHEIQAAIQRGSTLQVQDRQGKTPLHYAVRSNLDVLKYLSPYAKIFTN